jgi:cephalosporin hydroxylase
MSKLTKTLRNLFGDAPARQPSRNVCDSKADYLDRFRMTLAEWLIFHQKDVIFQDCKWMGVRALKNPLDAWIYQEIIYDVKPDVIVEIGSYEGGTTLFFAHILDLLGQGIVVSVDIDRSKYSARHDRIVEITGDSASEPVVEQVKKQCQGKRVLILHDGDHVKTHVLKDLEAYAPMVSVGSYFIVEDGIVDLFEAGDGLGRESDVRVHSL